MKKITIILAAAVMMSSCGLFSKYKSSESTTPENLYGAEAAKFADDSLNLAQLHWDELFTDDKLQALIDEALERNIDLLSAHENIKIAEANLKSARLSYLPSLSLSPYISQVGLTDLSQKTTSYSVPISASWEIDIFGRITNAKEQAASLFDQSKDYEQAVRTQIVASMANSYYTLLMYDSQLLITEVTEDNWHKSVTTAQRLRQAGMMTDAAVAQIEASYYAVQSARVELKRQIKVTENAICMILSSTPRPIERNRFCEQNFPESFSIGVPLDMVASRPDVRLAEDNLAQAFYGVNIARSALYPSLTLSGTLGWTNSAGGIVLDPARMVYNAMASLSAPLFNHGRNRADLAIAKAQHEQAKLQFEHSLISAGNEVNNALIQYQSAVERSKFHRKQLIALDIAARSTKLTMDYGSTTYLEVLTAQQTLLNAELDFVANHFSRVQGIITLYNALGGGCF